MTSKKEKRARALKKREDFIKQVKADGLRAQEQGRREEEEELALARKEVAAVNARYQKILDNATPEDWENARRSIG